MARRFAFRERLARCPRGLISCTEQSSLKRMARALRDEEAEAAMLEHDDARRLVTNLNDVC